MIGAFSRTYAQAVAGTTLSMAFNSTDASFALQFTSNPNITAPTEIYLNEAVHYPSGFNCAVSPSASGKCVHSGTNSLFVYASSATPTNLTVTVTAA